MVTDMESRADWGSEKPGLPEEWVMYRGYKSIRHKGGLKKG